MIPSANTVLNTDIAVVQEPSVQYKMRAENDRIMGICDGIEAVKQTIYKILNTERYAYMIYSWNYGVELMDLYGQSPLSVCPQIERRIREALTQDDRIRAVDRFEFDVRSKKGAVLVSFTVHTIFGDLEDEMEVDI